jgi:hypothetical protein
MPATNHSIDDLIEAAAFPNPCSHPSSTSSLRSFSAAMPSSAAAASTATAHSEGSDSSGWESNSPEEDDQSRLVQNVAIEGAVFFNS